MYALSSSSRIHYDDEQPFYTFPENILGVFPYSIAYARVLVTKMYGVLMLLYPFYTNSKWYAKVQAKLSLGPSRNLCTC
jgi:hypothetical protein